MKETLEELVSRWKTRKQVYIVMKNRYIEFEDWSGAAEFDNKVDVLTAILDDLRMKGVEIDE